MLSAAPASLTLAAPLRERAHRPMHIQIRDTPHESVRRSLSSPPPSLGPSSPRSLLRKRNTSTPQPPISSPPVDSVSSLSRAQSTSSRFNVFGLRRRTSHATLKTSPPALYPSAHTQALEGSKPSTSTSLPSSPNPTEPQPVVLPSSIDSGVHSVNANDPNNTRTPLHPSFIVPHTGMLMNNGHDDDDEQYATISNPAPKPNLFINPASPSPLKLDVQSLASSSSLSLSSLPPTPLTPTPEMKYNRSMSKLQRMLGENVPATLVHGDTSTTSATPPLTSPITSTTRSGSFGKENEKENHVSSFSKPIPRTHKPNASGTWGGRTRRVASSFHPDPSDSEFETHLTKMTKRRKDNYKGLKGGKKKVSYSGAMSDGDVDDEAYRVQPLVFSEDVEGGRRVMSSREKAIHVKRAMKMTKMFGALPPMSALLLARAGDAEGKADMDDRRSIITTTTIGASTFRHRRGSSFGTVEDSMSIISDVNSALSHAQPSTSILPPSPPILNVRKEDDTASILSVTYNPPKKQPPPTPPVDTTPIPAYPYISTLSAPMPLSTIQDQPFHSYAAPSTVNLVGGQLSLVPKAKNEKQGQGEHGHRRAASSGAALTSSAPSGSDHIPPVPPIPPPIRPVRRATSLKKEGGMSRKSTSTSPARSTSAALQSAALDPRSRSRPSIDSRPSASSGDTETRPLVRHEIPPALLHPPSDSSPPSASTSTFTSRPLRTKRSYSREALPARERKRETTTTTMSPSFQTRRRQAAKLTRFFGVDYADLQGELVHPTPSSHPSTSTPSSSAPVLPRKRSTGKKEKEKGRSKTSMELDSEDEDGSGDEGEKRNSTKSFDVSVVLGGGMLHSVSKEEEGDARVIKYRREDVKDVLGVLRQLH